VHRINQFLTINVANEIQMNISAKTTDSNQKS
jgi:hypothetical protein